MKKVSLILLTIDRFEITRKTIDRALKNSGHSNIELLVIDNGSTDRKVIDYIASLNPAVHILHDENKGMQYSQNLLLTKSTGDYICFIGNDILLPENWLADLIFFNDCIPDSGISGIHCVMHKPEIVEHNSVSIRKNETVFGTMFFNRKWFETVGYVNECFAPYGMDDSEYSFRSRRMGFVNYYLPNLSSEHIGHDVGEDSAYRRMKDEALSKSEALFKISCDNMDKNQMYYYKPNWIE